MLVGIRPYGYTFTIEGMRDGARYQVYPALRIATLEKHLDAGEPAPFILDDILVRFDEVTARATSEILAELSNKPQILSPLIERYKEISICLNGGNAVSIHSVA